MDNVPSERPVRPSQLWLFRWPLPLLLVATGYFCVVTDATAQDLASQLQQCGKISDSLSRLQCYDNIVKQPGLSLGGGSSNASSAPTSTDNWTVNQSNNPLDDSKTVVISNDATSGVTDSGNPISLLLRCQSGQLDAFITWGYFLGDDDIDTTIRLGTAPANDESWPLSTDKTAAFSPAPGQLIKGIISADSLVVEVTPYDHDPVLATFSITGLSQVITPLAQDCGLKL